MLSLDCSSSINCNTGRSACGGPIVGQGFDAFKSCLDNLLTEKIVYDSKTFDLVRRKKFMIHRDCSIFDRQSNYDRTASQSGRMSGFSASIVR